MASDPARDPILSVEPPAYGAWGPREYEELGMISGLEVHQQLLTRRKLFCRCPAGRYSKKHDAEILRHMRPTLSEMGDYDGTALMEFKTQKEITYLLTSETVCTYEMDDAPPFEIDDEALDASITVSMMLGLEIIDEVHIARKQYLDGSIPTGFQRTAIIGLGGKIPFRGREVRIRQLSIEEDSCREVSDKGHDRVYRTDRLGMPLIETVTDPDMRTPEEVAAVCDLIRRVSRASGLARTGSGAGREDVNVSIRGGTRIEIKGVSSIKSIPELVHNEAIRQRALLRIREILEERGVRADGIVDRSEDITSLLDATNFEPIRHEIERGGLVRAVPLPGFDGLLEAHTQPHTRFLKEFADRVRVVACLDAQPGLLCSTSALPSLSSAEWKRITKRFSATPDAPILLVWGAARDVETAAGEILLRAREATLGIPEETRQSLVDGTTGFERVLPGPSRMYPDTDLPPIVLSADHVANLRAKVPESPWQRLALLEKDGVGEDLRKRLACSKAYPLYAALRELPFGERLSRHAFASLLLDRQCLVAPDPRAAEWWRSALLAVLEGRCVREALYAKPTGEAEELPSALEEAEAKRLVENAFDAAASAPLAKDWPEDREKHCDAMLRSIMDEVRGRVPGRLVRTWIMERLG